MASDSERINLAYEAWIELIENISSSKDDDRIRLAVINAYRNAFNIKNDQPLNVSDTTISSLRSNIKALRKLSFLGALSCLGKYFQNDNPKCSNRLVKSRK